MDVRNNLLAKLIRVEDALNRRLTDVPVLLFHRIDNKAIRKAFDSRANNVENLIEYLNRILPEKGFRFEDGSADYVAFYKFANITPNVWHTMISGKNKPSPATLRRMIIALKLDEVEARKMMALCGQNFDPNSESDRLLLACIECGYRTAEEVEEIFEHYAEIYPNGHERFKSPYFERERKQNQEE